jgi:hypothetical protein
VTPVTITGLGSVIVTNANIGGQEGIAASVIVTVYVPADKPVAVFVV